MYKKNLEQMLEILNSISKDNKDSLYIYLIINMIKLVKKLLLTNSIDIKDFIEMKKYISYLEKNYNGVSELSYYFNPIYGSVVNIFLEDINKENNEFSTTEINNLRNEAEKLNLQKEIALKIGKLNIEIKDNKDIIEDYHYQNLKKQGEIEPHKGKHFSLKESERYWYKQ